MLRRLREKFREQELEQNFRHEAEPLASLVLSGAGVCCIYFAHSYL